ncbi:enoyl-CoA hydratase/isomerase family protein [Altererythrobacter sp. FM1]|uniref:enoyl-CoA hydratase/isomerase family protein n=1 Tax=Tsuneonella flava TaxID=2055955 RepID=UPI000C80C0D6|nr:enoyl-CoA hydratase/isomerase family protein [Tsuneonella flava]ROT97368.1 enoyl-CoA hydratase/isomerase family protein [Altererythrobacter sp. FM1]
MSDQSVIVETRDGAVWITLNRPAALNAITPDIVAGVMDALTLAEAPDIKAVVVTGTGRAFCAGADLKYVNETSPGDEAATAKFLDSLLDMMAALEACPRPVIAAVNGMALAGGLEVVLCCDLVIAARSAKLGDAHANFGLLPGGGGSVRLPRKIGSTRAKYLMFTGDFVPAEDLVACGLVNEVVDDSELMSSVEGLVAKLGAKSSLVLRRMKALVDDGLEQPKDVALRSELLVSEIHVHSHDMKEGLVAFEEKRAPSFIGR